jgi:hypothetical protein
MVNRNRDSDCARHRNDAVSLRLHSSDAAKAAIRFEKPAPSSVDQKGDVAPRYIAYLPQGSATPEEWLAEHGHLKGEMATRQ